MPRPVSWQSSLRTIHRQISESPRTPYSRGELQSIFKVKERAAQRLMELMPRHGVGRESVVERESLITFVRGAIDADDLGAYLEELRKNPPKVARRKVRLFIPRDFVERTVTPSLKKHEIYIERNSVEVLFSTYDDFCSKMAMLISVIEDPDFEGLYCDPAPAAPSAERDEGRYLKSCNHFMHRVRCARLALDQDNPELARIFQSEAALAFARVEELGRELGCWPDESMVRYRQQMESRFPDVAEALEEARE